MNLIEEIKQRVTIESLCDYAGIQKVRTSGKGFFIRSIFNPGDNNPSMMIYTDTNTYYDYSTSQHGDVINFFEHYYQRDTKTAVRELASIARIDLSGDGINRSGNGHPEPVEGCHPSHFDKLSVTARQERERKSFIESLSEKEKEFYEERAALSDEATAKREAQFKRLEMNKKIFAEFRDYCVRKYSNDKLCNDYMIKQRRIPARILNQFKVFFVGNYNEVNNHLKKTFEIDDLRRAGILSKKKDNLLFYAHRIIFPYLYADGSIVYLRGRYFDKDGNSKTDESKFIGLSNDGTNVNTSKRFYNFFNVIKQSAGAHVYIVEGEPDTLSVEALGYNCLGVPGAGNLPAIKKFLQLYDYKIKIIRDNDDAGLKLQENLVKVFDSLGMSVALKTLPEGIKDANEFLKAG